MMHARCPQTSSGNHRGDVTLERTRPGSSGWEGFFRSAPWWERSPGSLCPHARRAAGNPYWPNLVHKQEGPKPPWDLESQFEETGLGQEMAQCWEPQCG